MIIAIDGPAASGKSTVAKAIARQMGFDYLDTGAMYRAVAFRALQEGIDLSDESADEDACERIAASEEITFAHDAHGGGLPTRVFIGDEDVTAPIRTPAVDAVVSIVARMPRVREALVAQQRHLGAAHDTVVEGRDIGTVVFPDAEVKVFLTASTQERARRREIDHSASGHVVQIDSVRESLERRDTLDSTREASPLARAADAVELDTTGLTISQVVERIAALAGRGLKDPTAP